jgi:hypothetical protein
MAPASIVSSFTSIIYVYFQQLLQKENPSRKYLLGVYYLINPSKDATGIPVHKVLSDEAKHTSPVSDTCNLILVSPEKVVANCSNDIGVLIGGNPFGLINTFGSIGPPLNVLDSTEKYSLIFSLVSFIINTPYLFYFIIKFKK